MNDQSMSPKDLLLTELKKAEAELNDVEEIRLFTLSQTGVHLGAGRMRSLQAGWDRDEARLRRRIDEIKAWLEQAT